MCAFLVFYIIIFITSSLTPFLMHWLSWVCVYAQFRTINLSNFISVKSWNCFGVTFQLLEIKEFRCSINVPKTVRYLPSYSNNAITNMISVTFTWYTRKILIFLQEVNAVVTEYSVGKWLLMKFFIPKGFSQFLQVTQLTPSSPESSLSLRVYG